MYPAPELLRMCVAAGKPIALSSDAHEPQAIGYAYDEAVGLLRDAGVERICVFEGRERREEPLG
jgi:histidinol-phosphatase (PHP family)